MDTNIRNYKVFKPFHYWYHYFNPLVLKLITIKLKIKSLDSIPPVLQRG